jgi:hypothetical protein
MLIAALRERDLDELWTMLIDGYDDQGGADGIHLPGTGDGAKDDERPGDRDDDPESPNVTPPH